MTDEIWPDDELDALLASIEPVVAAADIQYRLPSPDRLIQMADARRRRRRRLLALPVVPAILVGATAAAVALRSQPPEDSQTITISCAGSLSQDYIAGITAFSADPVADCSNLWPTGRIPGNASRPAPALQACISSGRVTVYPGATACSILNEPNFSRYSDAQLRAIRLNAGLAALVAEDPCAGESQLRSLAQEQLALFDFSNWEVTFVGTGACFGVSVDLGRGAVIFLAY